MANVASVGLTANITLYDGGQNKYALAAAKEAVLSTRQALVGVEQQVLLATVGAFMEVRRARKTAILRQNNVRVIQEELRAAKDRFEVGEVTKTDVALAEARLAASKSALAVARGERAQADENYKQTVGSLPKNLSAPGRLPKLVSSAVASKNSAVQHHPDIIAIQHDIKQAEYNMKRAAGVFRPTVSLSSSLNYTDQAGDEFQRRQYTASSRSLIYKGGRLPALLRQATARHDAQRSILHLTRLKLNKKPEVLLRCCRWPARDERQASLRASSLPLKVFEKKPKWGHAQLLMF